jgi:predicted nucleic acid-binding protein
LEGAVAADADYLVSGDAALVNLESYQGIRIVRPTQFLKFYPANPEADSLRSKNVV